MGILRLSSHLIQTFGFMAKKAAERKSRIFADDPPEPAPDAGSDDKPERLSFPLAADGSIAVEQLRPATRDKLKRALASPAARSALFGGAPAGPSPEDLALCGAVYDTLSSILVSVYRASGYSVEQASYARYTEDQKAAMVPLTAKVFNKWVGDFAYMDELMLCVMVATITSQNLANVQKAPARVVSMVADEPAS